MHYYTFCQVIHLVCFILAVYLLLCCFVPRWAAKVRLMEAIIATAIVAWLCVMPIG